MPIVVMGAGLPAVVSEQAEPELEPVVIEPLKVTVINSTDLPEAGSVFQVPVKAKRRRGSEN